MYKRILVATDGSPLSGKAIEHAIALAGAVGAKLIALHASPGYPLPSHAEGSLHEGALRKDYEATVTRNAEKILDEVKRKAVAARIECTNAHTIGPPPWEAILDTARANDADAIVMASHGRRGLTALLLGSETQKVLTHSTIPVTVVR